VIAEMTAKETLLGPLLPTGKITTLTGPPGEEMATLAASIAVSYRTGTPIIPGWAPPVGPGLVTVLAYAGSRIEWTGLVQDICDDAGIAVPVIDIGFPEYLSGQAPPVERDSDADAFWDASDKAAAAEVAVEAIETGRRPLPKLTVVYAAHAAAPSDALMLRLYKKFAGETALVVTAPSAFSEDGWAPDELRASDFGPVIRLEDIRDQLVAASIAGSGVIHTEHAVPVRSATEVAALAAAASGVGLAVPSRVDSSSSPGILYGYAIVWGEWAEIDREGEGNFLLRYVFGSFARTIRERWPGRKVYFCHGKDSRFGTAALGPILTLVEDSHGLFYEVLLDDTPLNHELARGLRAAMYDGSSITYRPIASVLDRNPGTSPHNPKGLPEETITEALLQELGPVREPQFKGTTCGIRKAVAPARERPQKLEEVRGFFDIEGADALTAFLRDAHSVDSQKLRRRARAEGIGGGQLWRAAMWLATEEGL
jgi:phage head maturation protease